MGKKPPKPEGRNSSPRFKSRKNPQSSNPGKPGREAALRAVRALIGETASSPQHVLEFFDQVRGEKNDRGAAILTATNTENFLRHALARRLALKADDHDRLFGQNGPMGTFDLKIRMGVALKILGPETEGSLIIIRTIRNTFAHSNIPVTFATPEIEALCNFLVMPFVLYPKSITVIDGKIVDSPNPTGARKIFTAVCEALGHNLLIYGQHCFQKPRPHPDDDRYEAWLTPAPLP